MNVAKVRGRRKNIDVSPLVLFQKTEDMKPRVGQKVAIVAGEGETD